MRSQYPDVDVTLFQGSGKSSEHRVVLSNFHRSDFPARCLDELSANHLEKRSFALALYPRLRAGRYDVVHYNELTMGSALFHLRNAFGGRFKLLYCNGAPSPPIHYHHRCDFVQTLTGPDYDQTREFGIPPERLFFLPYGLDSELFHPDHKRNRAAIRQEFGIPQEATLILSVAALKTEHKRIDYLIQEVSQLSGNVWLLVAGQRTRQTEQLETLAEALMPGRWRFESLAPGRIADLYGAADLFVLCSLTEAFGLVSIEAILSELPTIIHDGSIFRWLTEGTSVKLIDMAMPGKLRSAISEHLPCPIINEEATLARDSRTVACHRFSWQALIPQYLKMYRTVTQGQ